MKGCTKWKAVVQSFWATLPRIGKDKTNKQTKSRNTAEKIKRKIDVWGKDTERVREEQGHINIGITVPNGFKHEFK